MQKTIDILDTRFNYSFLTDQNSFFDGSKLVFDGSKLVFDGSKLVFDGSKLVSLYIYRITNRTKLYKYTKIVLSKKTASRAADAKARLEQVKGREKPKKAKTPKREKAKEMPKL